MRLIRSANADTVCRMVSPFGPGCQRVGDTQRQAEGESMNGLITQLLKTEREELMSGMASLNKRWLSRPDNQADGW